MMETLFPEETQYRVLPLWQPWATLFVYGIKKIETRPSPTSWTAEKGTYLIHAASKWSKEQFDICMQEPFKSELIKLGLIDFCEYPTNKPYAITHLPLGQIIGSIEVTECKPIYEHEDGYPYFFDIFYHRASKHIIEEPERSFGDYREGRYAWLTQNPRILKNPIPYKGGQGYYQKFKGDINQLEFY